MAESTTSEKRLAAVERQRQALELRKAGVGFQAIADQLGYDGPSGAYQAVKSALKKTLQEPADELRQLELARLDAMLKAVWLRATNAKCADLGAIDRALKIMERRAKLLGLDAPGKVNIDVMVQAAADDLGLTADEQDALMGDVQAFIAEQKGATA